MLQDEGSVCAVVPVRGGSRRLKNKNLAPFGGTTLLAHKLRQLKRCSVIDHIVVSSDSLEMLRTADREGVEAQSRPAEFADDQLGRSLSETIFHVVGSLPDYRNVLWAQVTSPLVDEHLYLEALSTYERALASGHDSLATVTQVREFLWNDDQAVNYVPGEHHVQSQNLPQLFRMTFGVLAAPRKDVLEWSYYHGPKVYRMKIGKRESVDIDDGLDLAAAQAWLDLSVEQSPVEPFQEF